MPTSSDWMPGDLDVTVPELDAGSPLARGLLAWWPMRPAGGVTVFDLGPTRSSDGSTLGSPSWGATAAGPGLSVSGGASFSAPIHAAGPGDFTVRIVHRPRIWADYTTVVDKASTLGYRDLSIFVDASGNLNYYTFGGAGGGISVPTGMTPGQTWDLVVTRAGSGARAYIDGRPVGSPWAAAGVAWAEPINFGRNVSGGGAHYDGTYVDCALWGRALSAGEVAALSAGPLGSLSRRPSSLTVALLGTPGGGGGGVTGHVPAIVHHMRMQGMS